MQYLWSTAEAATDLTTSSGVIKMIENTKFLVVKDELIVIQHISLRNNIQLVTFNSVP